ncbi:MAG: 30S ribosomal protein S6 [Candidatus Azambacteria bacterium]|nr:30S ribosomal protein S6 [Candidatus Azambacteria bacterium]
MNDMGNTKEYEMSYLLTPEISEDKTDFEIAELKKIIVDSGGDAIEVNPLEKKQLAYSVKKQNQAYFGVVYFNIGADGLDKIKKTLALYKKVLRYLILNKVLKPKPEIAAVVQPSAETPAAAQSFDKRLEDLLKS